MSSLLTASEETTSANKLPLVKQLRHTFMLSGFFAGLAGAIQFAQRQSVDPLRGEGLELIAVAATVIGGVRLQEGFGNVTGAAFGVILLSMLEQGLVSLTVPLRIFHAIAGAIVILSAVFSKYVQSDTEEALIEKLFIAEVHIG